MYKCHLGEMSWRQKCLKNLFVQIRNFLLQVLDLGDDAFERLLVVVL